MLYVSQWIKQYEKTELCDQKTNSFKSALFEHNEILMFEKLMKIVE